MLLPALFACDGAAEPAAPAARDVPAPAAPTAAFLSIVPAKARIDRGELLRLDVIAQDAQRRVLPRAAVTWSSADTTIAAVDQGGVVRAVSAGYVAVTVTSGAAAAYALLQIAVNGEYPHGVVLEPALVTLSACGPVTFTALTDPDIRDTRFDWSTSDPQVVQIDAPGIVHGVAPGTADLTVVWRPDPSRRVVRTLTVTGCGR